MTAGIARCANPILARDIPVFREVAGKGVQSMKPVAVTIVAKNYLALARTLCDSFLAHHTGGEFFVLLVDNLDDELDASNEKFRLVNYSQLDLPYGDLFCYQYSILELSTAVKPFLLRYLLDKHNLESLLYLDPDILIISPLTAVFEVLATASIVLTPHMFSPPPADNLKPTEGHIMLSGAYNLGFLAVRNDRPVAELLAWWSDRLANKCVVDLPNALFVDQRWMDLAPSYFDGVAILRDPGLNVAYWNLHERELAHDNGSYTVNGKPLVFYHFSGFNPNTPDVLSKHQTRHDPASSSALRSLVGKYTEALWENEHARLSKLENAFQELANRVRLGRLTQYAVRKALEKNLPISSPLQNPEGFCRFLMTPNRQIDARGISPILIALEYHRPDVRAAYPTAFESPEHASLARNWVRSSGGKEEGITELFVQYGYLLDRPDVVQLALSCWRRRTDLRRAFPAAFASVEGSTQFAQWIEKHGTQEAAFAVGDGGVFVQRRSGLLRVLMLYVQDQNLQREFPFLFIKSNRERFVHWLNIEACARSIVSPEDVAWFDGFAESAPEVIAAVTFGFGAWLQANLVGGGTLFDLRNLQDMLRDHHAPTTTAALMRLYASVMGRSMLAQAEQYYLFTPEIQQKFPNAFRDLDSLYAYTEYLCKRLIGAYDGKAISQLRLRSALERRNNVFTKLVSGFRTALGEIRGGPAFLTNRCDVDARDIAEKLRAELRSYDKGSIGVNLAGYLYLPTGLGESSRSMARTLAAANIPFKSVPLPSYHIGPWVDIDKLCKGEVLSAHDPSKRINVIVANGDEYSHIRGRLPYAFWANRINIGYWVWETETLPPAHSDCAALSEIWTPSKYSAAAIRKSVDIPVRVVPHVLDLAEIDHATANREAFGIPRSMVAYGYFFDCKSAVERKNPYALIRAFRQAFGTNETEAVLVLKVSSPELAPFEYSRLRRAAEGLHVLWVTDLLSRMDTLRLMKSLDVYVSLHRSEGFGLTLAEAMAMAKPVVATAYSGNMDFMNSGNSCMVTAEIIETDRIHGPYPAGTRWGAPDEGAATEYMRSLMDADMRRALGEIAASEIRRKLDPRTVGTHISNVIADFTRGILVAGAADKAGGIKYQASGIT